MRKYPGFRRYSVNRKLISVERGKTEDRIDQDILRISKASSVAGSLDMPAGGDSLPRADFPARYSFAFGPGVESFRVRWIVVVGQDVSSLYRPGALHRFYRSFTPALVLSLGMSDGIMSGWNK